MLLYMCSGTSYFEAQRAKSTKNFKLSKIKHKVIFRDCDNLYC